MSEALRTDRRTRIGDAIRRAALEEFACNGLSGASTQAIAKRAGLSKPQLHYYIAGKEELYEETLLSVLKSWDEQFFLSVGQHGPETAIRTYIDKKIRYVLAHPLECRLFSNEVARGAPVLRRYWARAREASLRAAEVIQEWVDTGQIKPVDPMVFQMELWAVTQHFADYEAQVRFLLDAEDAGEMDTERLIASAQSLFLRGVGLGD